MEELIPILLQLSVDLGRGDVVDTTDHHTVEATSVQRILVRCDHLQYRVTLFEEQYRERSRADRLANEVVFRTVFTKVVHHTSIWTLLSAAHVGIEVPVGVRDHTVVVSLATPVTFRVCELHGANRLPLLARDDRRRSQNVYGLVTQITAVTANPASKDLSTTPIKNCFGYEYLFPQLSIRYRSGIRTYPVVSCPLGRPVQQAVEGILAVDDQHHRFHFLFDGNL
ncbi:hypothetical protein D3C84_726310 [compost metagenome]